MELNVNKKILSLIVLPLSLSGIVACDLTDSDDESTQTSTLSMGVASDLHYYDSALGTSGAAFEEYLANDRKLIAESEALMEAFTEIAISSDWDYVLIPGDLTKDGEYASHEELAEQFATIENAGIEVYVVPGNHDINNGEAYSYSGSETTSVANVSADEFQTLFADYGYNQALAKDTNSLSYVARLNDNLVLIAMDSCKYDDNVTDEAPETSGAFSEDTQTWILEQIDTYVAAGDTVIGMMHHGIVEHHPSQSDYFSDYLVDDYEAVSEAFTSHGMHVVLTGHYHAQDIAVHSSDDGDIYDVMTGSLVTYPIPYRSIEWNDNTFSITSDQIEAIDYDYDSDNEYDSFLEYAYDYLIQGLSGQVATYAASAIYGDDATDDQVTATEAILNTSINDLLTTDPATDDTLTISDLLVDAFAVFYEGKDNDLTSGAAASSIDNTYSIITDLKDTTSYESAYSSYSSYYYLTGAFSEMLWAESYSAYDDYSFMAPDDNTYQIVLD
jgi:3',5'-cyclic AMP phosphodiesterase CpdA